MGGLAGCALGYLVNGWMLDGQTVAQSGQPYSVYDYSGSVGSLYFGTDDEIGNPIVPVIKLSANPRTVRTMSEHIDVDVSGLFRKELSPDQAGDKLLEMMFETANGRLTAAEVLGHREFVLTRLYESA